MPPELRQMQAVDAIAQTISSSPDDIVYISGSLIEGFGNRSSDIDVFLVTAGEPAYRGPFGSVLGDYYLDLEIYQLDYMSALSWRLDGLEVSDFPAVWLTPLADLDLYYRTLIGEAHQNAEGFEALRNTFRHDVIQRLLATWCGLRYTASMQHAREELAAGRFINAALAGQAATAAGLDSYLASRGEAFPSLKWRFEKLARLHGAASALYERAWSLKAAGARDPEPYLAGVEALGVDLGMEAYDAWSLDAVPLRTNGEVHDYDVAGDAHIVHNGRYVYRAGPGLRAVVRLLHDGAATRASVVSALSRGGSEPSSEVAHRVNDAIAKLQACNLIRAY